MFKSLGLSLLIVTVTACPALLRADDDSNVTFKSQDGLVQLVMPEGWVQQQSSNPSAAIEARNEDYDAYVMVIIASRDDPYALLDDYSKNLRDEVLSHLVKSKCSDPQELQVNGYKAVQYEIHGTSPQSRVQFGYFLTVVQMRRHYVEVISWGTEQHFAENAAVLKDSAKNVGYKEE